MASVDGAGICRHFLLGKCTGGPSGTCRFSHDDDAGGVDVSFADVSSNVAATRPLGAPSSQICRHFLRGKCNVAECRFSHGGEEEQEELGELGAPVDSEMDEAIFEPEGNAKAGISTTICRHFLEGKCTGGPSGTCRFSHGPDTEPPLRALPPRQQRPAPFAVANLLSPRQQRPAPVAAPLASGIGASICRHFLQGKCKMGDTCRFPHGNVTSVPPRGPLVPRGSLNMGAIAPTTGDICRHFLEGKCNRGVECRFSHGPAAPVLAQPAGGLIGDVCRHFLEGKCNYGDACRFPHGFAPAPLPRQMSRPMSRPMPATMALVYQPSVAAAGSGGNVCKHFLEGKCTYGDNCRFPHVAAAPAPIVHAGKGGPPLQAFSYNPNQMAGALTDERNVCRHFLRNKCEHGDDCGFLHPGVPSKPVCSHFIQGRCTYGDNCQFRHPKKLQERMASISVHGIPPDVEETDIIEYFNQFAPVAAVDLKRNADGSSKGWCTVAFDDSDAVLAVTDAGITHELDSQQVEVKRYEIPEGQVAAITRDYAAFKKGAGLQKGALLRRPGPY